MGDHLGTPGAVGLKMLFRTLSENIEGLVDWFEINCSLAFLGPYQKIMLGYTVCSVVALLHRYAILLCSWGSYQKISRCLQINGRVWHTVSSVVALLHRYAILLCFEDLIRKYRGACFFVWNKLQFGIKMFFKYCRQINIQKLWWHNSQLDHWATLGLDSIWIGHHLGTPSAVGLKMLFRT